MAGPALLGIGWLGAMLGAALFSAVNFVSKFLTRKIAVGLVAIAAFSAMMAGFVATIEGLLAGVSLVFPLAADVGIFLPDDFSVMVAAFLSARITWWLFWVNWHLLTVRWTI